MNAFPTSFSSKYVFIDMYSAIEFCIDNYTNQLPVYFDDDI